MKRLRAPRVDPRLRRGVYLLPSAFTAANILIGFLALRLGFEHRFSDAALLIYAAAILDTLDGRIARLTHTESDFGREFDSLADVLTFGMVPALLAYLWGLASLGRAGWLLPFFYVVCTATRLARFNVQTRPSDGSYFVGLPSPAAAGGVAAVLFFAPDVEWRHWFAALMMGSLALLGALMVSTFRYPAFKRLDLRRRLSFRVVVPIAAVLLVAAFHPTAFFLSAAVAYAASGPVGWIVGRLSPRRRASDPQPPQESAP